MEEEVRNLTHLRVDCLLIKVLRSTGVLRRVKLTISRIFKGTTHMTTAAHL